MNKAILILIILVFQSFVETDKILSTNLGNKKYKESINKFHKITNSHNLLISNDKKKNKKPFYQQKSLIGNWKVKCEEKKSGLLIFDSSNDGYLDIYLNNDYARVSVTILNKKDVKYSVLTGITRHNTFVNWLNISRDSSICKINRINNNQLELKWLGFYNIKTKKREMVNSPFNSNKNNKSVMLNNCD